MTSEIFSRGQAFLAQGTDQFLNKMLSIRKVRLLITSRYISMQSYECVIISKMFLIYFISYGCNGGALVFLGGAEASASPSFALPLFITIKKIIILHLFLGVPAATVGGTGTPWHTRGYAPGLYISRICNVMDVHISIYLKCNILKLHYFKCLIVTCMPWFLCIFGSFHCDLVFPCCPIMSLCSPVSH